MGSSDYNKAYYRKNSARLIASNYERQRQRMASDPEYAERKRQQARDGQRRRRQAHAAIKTEALLVPCVDCGIRLPPQVMDFDHVRGDKLFNLARSYAGKYWTLQQLRDEVAKCDVRCPNCHRMRHYVERLPNEEGRTELLACYLRRARSADDPTDAELRELWERCAVGALR